MGTLGGRAGAAWTGDANLRVHKFRKKKCLNLPPSFPDDLPRPAMIQEPVVVRMHTTRIPVQTTLSYTLPRRSKMRTTTSLESIAAAMKAALEDVSQEDIIYGVVVSAPPDRKHPSPQPAPPAARPSCPARPFCSCCPCPPDRTKQGRNKRQTHSRFNARSLPCAGRVARPAKNLGANHASAHASRTFHTRALPQVDRTNERLWVL